MLCYHTLTMLLLAMGAFVMAYGLAFIFLKTLMAVFGAETTFNFSIQSIISMILSLMITLYIASLIKPIIW